ncbi:MAG: hypothetical protein WCX81_03325 [Monoglobales bacterium]
MSIDYDYYSNIYRGNIIPCENFAKSICKAEYYIDGLIFGRDTAGFEESVKLAACNIAELLYLDETRQGISAENVDGYSVSYRGNDIEKSIADAAEIYLASSGLLYAGAGE